MPADLPNPWDEGERRRERKGWVGWAERGSLCHTRRGLQPDQFVQPTRSQRRRRRRRRAPNPTTLPPISAGSRPHFSISILTFCLLPAASQRLAQTAAVGGPAKIKSQERDGKFDFYFHIFLGFCGQIGWGWRPRWISPDPKPTGKTTNPSTCQIFPKIYIYSVCSRAV